MNSLISPSSMNFAEESSFGCDFYKIYYNWCRAGNKHRNYDGFKQYIKSIYFHVTNEFDKDECNFSYQVTMDEMFVKLCNSLNKIKEDKHTVETDVNSILHIIATREKDKSAEVYFISLDKALISWLNGIYKINNGIVDSPSTWLSILLKYSGREKADDYNSFCQFIRLPIVPEPKSDLKKEIEIKSSIMSSNYDDAIKDKMIQEVRNNFGDYKEVDTDEIICLAYAKTEEQIKSAAKEEFQVETNKKIEEEKAEAKSSRNKEIAQIKKSAEETLKQKTENAYSEGQLFGETNVLHTIARKKVKRNIILKKVVGISLFAVIAIMVLSILLLVISKFNTQSKIWTTITNISSCLGIVTFILTALYSVCKWVFGSIHIITHEAEMFSKLKNKYKTKK